MKEGSLGYGAPFLSPNIKPGPLFSFHGPFIFILGGKGAPKRQIKEWKSEAGGEFF